MKFKTKNIPVVQKDDAFDSFFEAWTHCLHALDSRYDIYKYLLVAITEVLNPGKGITVTNVSNRTSEEVEAEFKIFIKNYSAAEVLTATDKVLQWYNARGTDVVMKFHIKNVINKMLQENLSDLSFKEKLTLAAEEHLANLDITEKMDKVKNKLKAAAIYRQFYIHLYKTEPESCLAIGNDGDKSIAFFVPEAIELIDYYQLFRNDLIKNLGFDSSDISYKIISDRDFDCCTIKLTW